VVPPTTTVPNLIGVAEGDAIALLTQAKLVARVQPIHSLQPAGSVVFQSRRAGGTMEIGLPVTIYVSTGQRPAGAMPAVAGLTLQDAYNTINRFIYSTGVWLDVYVTYVPVTDESQRGIVFGQTPPAGQAMNYKDAVTLTVGEPAAAAPPATPPPAP
jgi:serine/threonine-protein kinase